MKKYNCPDCRHLEDTCENCLRAVAPLRQFENSKKCGDAPIPQCCRNCPNHPVNNGSGICNCVLPYMTNSTISYTYSAELTIDK